MTDNSSAEMRPSLKSIDEPDESARVPRPWLKAIAVFWVGYVVVLLFLHVFDRVFSLLLLLLVSLFFALAIEPAVNWLTRRGWKRGRATLTMMLLVLAFVVVFVAAMGTLVAQQIADILGNLESYVTKIVDFSNDNFGTNIVAAEILDSINDPNGPVQEFILNQGDTALQLSLSALNLILQTFSVSLFTYYLVADGPKWRRSICSRLRPTRQQRVLDIWELAIDKTGGYLYSRAFLAACSAFAHWVLLASLGSDAPLALAIWVGLISQFVPVVGTYVAGALPVLLTLLDSPQKAIIIAVFVIVYQQVENYFLLPRITARTMNLHPAIAFGSALAGASILGAVGAVLALPAAAMIQGIVSASGERHRVIDSELTDVAVPTPTGPIRTSRWASRRRKS